MKSDFLDDLICHQIIAETRFSVLHKKNISKKLLILHNLQKHINIPSLFNTLVFFYVTIYMLYKYILPMTHLNIYMFGYTNRFFDNVHC